MRVGLFCIPWILFRFLAFVFLAFAQISLTSPLGWADAESKPASYHYVLSSPLETSVTLGVYEKTYHYGLKPLWSLGGQPLVLYYAGGENLALVAGYLAYTLPKELPSIGANMTLNLKAKQLWKSRQQNRELAKIENVKRIRFLNSSELYFKKVIFPQEMKTRGIAFLETDAPLPENPEKIANWNPEWGRPIALSQLDETRLNIQLTYGTHESALEWHPTIQQLFSKDAVPKEIAGQWKQEMISYTQNQKRRARGTSQIKNPVQQVGAWIKGLFDPTLSRSIRLNAELIFPDGTHLKIGTLATGSDAKKLVRLTSFQKLTDWARNKLGLPEKAAGGLRVQATRTIEPGKACSLKDTMQLLFGQAVISNP